MAERQIVVKLLGDASKFKRELGSATKEAEGFAAKMRKASGVASVAIGGVLVGALKQGVSGVMEQQTADAKLVDTLSRVPKAVRPSAAAIEAYGDAQQKSTMFTHEAVDATAAFLASQDGVQSAVKGHIASFQDLTQTSLDLATVLGVDGPTGAKLLAKALAAPDKASKTLQRAGITLTDAETAKMKAWAKSGDKGKEQALILDKLTQKTKGAADAAGKTLPGQIERAKNAFGEMEEGMASGLMPVITKLLGKLVVVSAWLQDNPGKVQVIVGALVGLAGVLATISVATKIWTAATTIASAATKIWAGAQWLLNAAMDANPITLIVLGIVGLIAVVVVIATKTQWFQKLWHKAWSAIKAVFSSVFNFIRDHWQGIAAILAGPVGIAVKLIHDHIGQIKAAFSGARKWLVNAGRDIIKGLITGMGSMAGAVKDHLVGLGKKIVSWKGPPSYDKVMLRGNGRLIINGLIDGMADNSPKVEKFLDGLTDKMRAKFDKLNGLVQTARDTSANIVSALAGSLNAPGDNGSVIAQLMKQAADTKKLKGVIAGLAKLGLKKDLLSGLVSGGLASIPAAMELLQGGKGAVHTANRLDNSINANARAIGNAEAFRTTGVGLAGNGTTVITFAPSGNAVIDMLMGEIKKYVRTNGGAGRVFVQ